jgi:hypothetical protein
VAVSTKKGDPRWVCGPMMKCMEAPEDELAFIIASKIPLFR